MVNQLSEFARLMEQTGRNLQLVLDVAGGRTEDLQRSLPPPSLQAGEAPALKQLDAASFEASVSLDVLATGLGVRPVAGTGAGIDAPANAPGTLPQREEYFELLERFREWCVDRRKVFVLEARAALCAHMGESPTLPPPPSDKRVEAARKTRSRSNEPADAAPGKDAGVPASGSIASDGGAGEKVRGGRIRCVETGKVYDSVKAAKQEIGPKDIGRALSVPGATAGGLHWERVLDDGNPPPAKRMPAHPTLPRPAGATQADDESDDEPDGDAMPDILELTDEQLRGFIRGDRPCQPGYRQKCERELKNRYS